MKVLKFGGTSVGSAERMRQVGNIILDGKQKIVVLSAVSGTTNALVKIGETFEHGDKDEARNLLEELEKSYGEIINDLFSSDNYKEKATTMIAEHFNFMKSFAVKVYNLFQERTLLAQGELMSTKLFNLYLEEKGENSVLLPALEFMRTNRDEEPDMDYISEHIAKEIGKNPDAEVYITQGFVCRNSFGEVDNLKRGGSDYTASLIGNAVKADEIQIWTDIDGMHNNDPRVVNQTKPVAKLNFEEAAELAYFGAKILHPQSIRPAEDANIPVRLLNTMDPKAKGTTIGDFPDDLGDTVKAIAAKDNIVAIKIKSARMLLAYGFLRSVFEVFERYKTPIDMITTSEVAVSLTIDKLDNLNDIIDELEGFGIVEVDKNQTIICIVGNMIASKEGVAEKIFTSMNNIPLRMISYGGSNHNITLLVDSSYKNKALAALNEGLFTF